MINDEVISSSKWCTTSVPSYAVIDLGENKEISRWIVYHANARGAGEGVDMNTVAFDFQYAPDDGEPLLTGDDSASRSRVRNMQFTVADRVTGNKQNVTDRNLSEPITARYIKLNITQSDNSAWHAVRIYEFQVYEEPGTLSVAAPSTPLARNVTVHNNEGATDTVVVDNVGMLYTSGTYADGNGKIDPDTGVVKLYDSLDAEEPIAQVQAKQDTESQKQRSVGTATFEGLELNPEGGRLFYEITDASGGAVLHSARCSVEYGPETGDAIARPTESLKGSVKGFQLTEHVDSAAAPQYGTARQRYGVLTLSDLPEGAEVAVYASADSTAPILHSSRAINGTAHVDGVPLSTEGGAVYYEVNASGYPTSERFAIEYSDPMTLPPTSPACRSSSTAATLRPKLTAPPPPGRPLPRPWPPLRHWKTALTPQLPKPPALPWQKLMPTCAARPTPSAWANWLTSIWPSIPKRTTPAPAMPVSWSRSTTRMHDRVRRRGRAAGEEG